MVISIQQLIQALKGARESQGLTQRELAGQLGFPQSHLSKIEAGQVNVKLASFLAMARMLELEVMLVPRQHVSLVKGLMDSKEKMGRGLEIGPAYTLDEEPPEEG